MKTFSFSTNSTKAAVHSYGSPASLTIFTKLRILVLLRSSPNINTAFSEVMNHPPVRGSCEVGKNTLGRYSSYSIALRILKYVP